MEQSQAFAAAVPELNAAMIRALYLRLMKFTALPKFVSGLVLVLCCTAMAAQVNTAGTSTVPKITDAKDTVQTVDVEDTSAVDSTLVKQMAIQAELSREVDALSRTNLGTEQFTWTHLGRFKIERAGRQQEQLFWNNPKAEDNPHIWKLVNGPSDDVFYLDPKKERAATINLNSLQGNFIPARIAAKAGFTGNQTRFLPKKSDAWEQVESTDSTTVWTAPIEGGSLRLTLNAEKNADQAQAVYTWMCLQPLENFDLPFLAKKYPIHSLHHIDSKGTVFKFEMVGWSTLEEPLEVDASELSIKDPEQDLHTIAKEWAAAQKANSGQD